MFARQCLGELVHIAVQQGHKFHHHPRAALRVHGGPCGLSGGGDLDGLVHFGSRGQWHFGLHLAGGGVVDLGETA